MNITKEQLILDLKKAGIAQGDILVIHSSLKSIGMVDGGPATLVEALLESVGNDGGVLFPCLTFPGSATEFLRKTPSIDLRDVTISTGAVPRTAWNHPDACRSIHPTHAVAGFGKKGCELVSGTQSGQGPCGTDSPFYKAAMAGAKILMIGVTCSSNTTLHCIEELCAPYIFIGETFDVETVDFTGNSHQIKVKGYCIGVSRKFPSIEERMLDEGIMQMASIGQADMRVIDAKQMVEKVSAWAKNDPWLLAEKNNE